MYCSATCRLKSFIYLLCLDYILEVCVCGEWGGEWRGGSSVCRVVWWCYGGGFLKFAPSGERAGLGDFFAEFCDFGGPCFDGSFCQFLATFACLIVDIRKEVYGGILVLALGFLRADGM